jgi:ABC-type transporter Mla MlaB component
MFRLSKKEEEGGTVVTIDGQLSGDSIEVVEEWCSQATSKGQSVHLYLRDVSVVDQAGRSLLCRLARNGIDIRAAGVYTSYLVQALNAAAEGPMNSSRGGGPGPGGATRKKQ